MSRIKSLDLARGFTVLFIAPIHAILYYGKPVVYQNWFSKTLAFIAEGPGAQLFMLLMGISFTFSKHTSFKEIFKKALLLLLAGYSLNVLKFVLPACCGKMPQGLYDELQVAHNTNGLFHMLLVGDILQFAATALIVLYFVSRLPHGYSLAIILAVLICFIGPAAYGSRTGNYCLEMIAGQPPRVYFPVLPWLVYPLVGLYVGHCLKADRYVFECAAAIAIILLLISACFRCTYCTESSFYQTCPPSTMYHVAIVLLWLLGWHLLHKYVQGNFCFRLLAYCSQHITQIYIIQWIIIAWLLPVFGFRRLGLVTSVAVSLTMGLCVILISIFISHYQHKQEIYANKKNL